MSKNRELRQMRMELLRMRAPLERDDVASAAQGLRDDASRLRGAATTLKGMGALLSALTGRGGGLSGLSRLSGARNTGGLIGTVADQLMRRPWLAALALKGLRSAKRHPGIAVAAVVGMVVATTIAKRRRDPSDDIFSAPMG